MFSAAYINAMFDHLWHECQWAGPDAYIAYNMGCDVAWDADKHL